jgi:integrase
MSTDKPPSRHTNPPNSAHSQPHRLFEYGAHWLVQRTDTPNLSIYWCVPGTRRVERRSTGTSDLEQAKRELVRFVEAKRLNVTAVSPAVPTAVLHHHPGLTFPATPWTAPMTAAPGSVDPGPTIVDCMCTFIGRMKPDNAAVSKHSLAHWTDFCRLHGLVYPAELTPEMQEEFVAWRRRTRAEKSSRPLSNATLNRDFAVVRASLMHAWRRRKLAFAPYIMSLRNPPPRQRFLTAEESQRLLHACKPMHLKRFVLIALHTLQRPSAILGLRVEQVDLTHNHIDFLPAGQAQSSKQRPVVKMSGTLREVIIDAIASSQSGHVIESNGQPIASIKRAFAQAAASAGLKGVTPYTLRHTGATLLAAAGIPMRQIAGMLGHSTQRMTEAYAKHRPEFQAEAVAKLDELFRPPGQPICAPVRANRAPEACLDAGDRLPSRSREERSAIALRTFASAEKYRIPRGSRTSCQDGADAVKGGTLKMDGRLAQRESTTLTLSAKETLVLTEEPE